MRNILTCIVVLCGLVASGAALAQNAPAERRIALVVGNTAYQAGALNTPANDAGLIAQTLQAAGFDVVGARDLDQDSLRRALRDFLDKAQNSGPDAVAFVYLGGYGVQLEGENYFVPVDAKIARDTAIAAEAIRISDYARPLAALGLKATIVVLDAARANPFARSGPPLAGGLALVEPDPGMLVAFNATSGTVAPEGQGPYGPYGQALAEMMREGGLSLSELFDRVRLRVNDVTRGAEVPWHASRVEAPFVFFERAADAPPPAASPVQTAAIRARPIRDLGVQDAYVVALERDTLEGYSDFVAAYPDDPLAARVRAIIAARREAITWRRTRLADTPPAYWSYLRRYPRGPHAPDARRRLAFLAAALEPPRAFAAIEYDVPPPPPDEIVYVERPVLVFDDPVFGFAPPPRPPVIFLPPPPPEFLVLAPPPPPIGLFVLPIPAYRPVPLWVRPPAYVAAPPNNIIFNNIHNTVVINNTTNIVTITNRSGQTQTIPAAPQATGPEGARPGAAGPAAASIGPALPPSVAQKATSIQGGTPPGGTPGATPPGQPFQRLPTTALPPPGTPGAPVPPGAPPSQAQPAPGQPLPTPPGTGGRPGQLPTTQQGQPTTQQGQSTPSGGTPPGAAGRKGQKSTTQQGSPTPSGGVTPPSGSGQPAAQQGSPKGQQQNLQQQRQQQQQIQRQQIQPPRPQAPPPPTQASRPPPPPPQASRPPPPPPQASRPPPPPPQASRPPPPPPQASRPPPPPPQASRQPPPPQAGRPPPGKPQNCGRPGQPPCPKQ